LGENPLPVKPASNVSAQEPNVESTKLAIGTQVVILGPEKTGGDSIWICIESPAGDVRYIPESAVGKNESAPAGNPTVAGTTTGYIVPPGGDQSALAKGDELLLQAQQMYQQAMSTADPNQKRVAQYKLQWLQQMQVPPASVPPSGFSTSTGSVGPPNVAIGASKPGAPSTGGNTAMYTTTTQTAPAQWTKWGTLRRTAFQQDGQAMYRLEDDRGSPLGYALAAPGLTLEPYIGRLVTLYGPTAYRSDGALRADYTIVSYLDVR
jgi:hypothetical protein